MLVIDLEKCKKEFFKYVSRYDLQKENIKRKELHSLRVMEESRKIAELLKLDKEKIELAELIGLLHDIGRFEQYNKEEVYLNERLLDHADLGVEILKKDNYIKKYIDDEYYSNLIFKAIKNHNKLKIEEGLNEEELLFSKIIRDADKLDIFYEGVEIYWNKQIEKENVESSKISDKIEKQFIEKRPIQKFGNEKNDTVDGVLILLAYIYDINFSETFRIINKEDYINRILNRFDFKDEKTKEKIENLKKILLMYINSKI